jgi:hypothetical protein
VGVCVFVCVFVCVVVSARGSKAAHLRKKEKEGI